MNKDYVVQIESEEKLIELIKQAIGDRTLRKVEEEAGISHGLLGKVIKGNQKASVELLQKLTAEKAHPQNNVTYMMLMEAANYLPPLCIEFRDNDNIDTERRMISYWNALNLSENDWEKKVKLAIERKYGVKESDYVSVCRTVEAFEKSNCMDIIVTDQEGKTVWISFLYDEGEYVSDRIIFSLGKIAFAGADKYLIVANTARTIQLVEKAKESLRQVDLEIGTLLIEE